jgi:hypothetical protein
MGAVKRSVNNTIGALGDTGKFLKWRVGRALRVVKAGKGGLDPVATLQHSAKNFGQDMESGFGLSDTSVQKSTDPTYEAPPDTTYSDAARERRATRVRDQIRRAARVGNRDRMVQLSAAQSLYGQTDIY